MAHEKIRPDRKEGLKDYHIPETATSQERARIGLRSVPSEIVPTNRLLIDYFLD